MDKSAVFGVGVVAEVCPFVEEPFAVGIDYHTPWVGVFLKTVSDGEISKLRRVLVPLDRMATGPVPGRTCPRVKRHLEPIAGVVGRAANLGQIPARPEVPRPPLRVGLKPARGKDDGVARDPVLDCALSDPHA